MCKVILNADDLGYSPAVNRAILHVASFGTLTAASLMVNMPLAEYTAKSVRSSVPNLSLGLHFCLTSGRTVAPGEQIPLLIGSNGRFRYGFLGLWRLLNSKRKQEAIEQIRTEFHAQLAKMDQFTKWYGLRFDHLDSHQHVHVLPEIFDILEEEAQKRNLALRVPREHFGTAKRTLFRFSNWFPLGLLKKWILDYHLRQRKQTIGYYGILDTGQMEQQALLRILEGLSRKSAMDTYEINTHPSEHGYQETIPGVSASQGDWDFHRSPGRKREYVTLFDPRLKAMIAKKGIQLIGFST